MTKPNPHIADASEIFIKVQMQQTPDGLGATTGQVRDEALQALADGVLAKIDRISGLGASHPHFANYISKDEVKQQILDYFGASDE